MTAPRVVPMWQPPPRWNRSLPREWQRPEAITGAACKRPSRIRRALKFTGGVLVAVVLFFAINLILTPQFWAILGR
ncbi:MAG: hypothetical protein M0T69_02135 [Deltaproteobacteria bacterium]|nr:hypothetical protein [Deltaproteobacteria bacterium]